MQTRFERRGPVATALAVLFALVAAFALGAALVYALEPAKVVPGPAAVVQVHDQGSGGDLQASACVWVDHRKGC
jgi:hypothetical protein